MSADEATWDTAEKIAALRAACGSELKPYSADAPTLARFLRSRKGDVELAKKSLLRHQEWRAEATPEFPLKNTMPSAKTLSTGTAYVRGVDKLGRPAIIVRVRKHDGNMDRSEMQRQVIFYLDEAVGRAVRRSKPAAVTEGTAATAAAAAAAGADDHTGATAMQREQFVVILDATDTAWANVDTGATNFIFLMLAANMPERLGRLYILNAGFFFSMCWKVVEAFIDERTGRKISFLSPSDYGKLLDDFDANQLPKEYGGSDDYAYSADCVTGGDKGAEASEYVTVREGCLPAWHAAFAKPDASSTAAAADPPAGVTGGSGAV